MMKKLVCPLAPGAGEASIASFIGQQAGREDKGWMKIGGKERQIR
ncbi:hypothetical protein P9199_03485 [Geobacillus stearothermophilus]|nr:hypothetical protein [Geobacillus stearothermophilus]